MLKGPNKWKEVNTVKWMTLHLIHIRLVVLSEALVSTRVCIYLFPSESQVTRVQIWNCNDKIEIGWPRRGEKLPELSDRSYFRHHICLLSFWRRAQCSCELTQTISLALLLLSLPLIYFWTLPQLLIFIFIKVFDFLKHQFAFVRGPELHCRLWSIFWLSTNALRLDVCRK